MTVTWQSSRVRSRASRVGWYRRAAALKNTRAIERLRALGQEP
jgi:hypothetical protein